MKPVFCVVLLSLLAVFPATAQTQNTPVQIFPPAVPALPKGEARVTVSYTTSDKLPANVDAGTLLNAQSKAHRAIYEIAGEECKLLLDTIATECHVEAINIAATTQQRAAGAGVTEPWLNTNGSSVFRIKTKE